jgi:hypothetical protein
MRTEFQIITISQFSTKGEPSPISSTTSQFSNSVLNAEAALRSWELCFSTTDKHFHRGFVRITAVEKVEERKVKVTAEIGLRDHSGEWDDNYEGSAEILVIAEVADN